MEIAFRRALRRAARSGIKPGPVPATLILRGAFGDRRMLKETPDDSRGRTRRPPKTPKGRQVDPRALEEVRVLLGARPRRRDLLIEYLHLL